MCSWSSLDHGGSWKLLHHMAKGFYAPVTVVAVPEGGAIALKAVNDGRGPVGLTLVVSALSMASGMRRLTEAEAVVGPEAVVAVALVEAAALRSDEVLHWEWQGDASGEDIHALKPWKAFDLLDPGLEMGIVGHEVTLAAKAFAAFVAVEADVPGRFSDNAFPLIPGRPRTIRFVPDGADVPKFTVRHLHAATYGQT